MQNSKYLTRRTLFKRAGGVIAAAMFPLPVSAAREPAGPVMTRLSTYMSEARNLSLPADVMEKAKRNAIGPDRGVKREGEAEELEHHAEADTGAAFQKSADR